MCRCPVLLKREFWTEVLQRPRVQYVAEKSLLVARVVDFHITSLLWRRSGSKLISTDGFCSYHLLLIFLEQLPAIMVVEQLDSENFLVSEE